MPKSKRAKTVSLTKVKKKDRDWKGALIERVRQLCDEFPNVYVVRYRNMRNDRFKLFREDMKPESTFMLASTKKLQYALGRREEEEHRAGGHLLVPHLRGFAGLLFSRLAAAAVQEALGEYAHDEFARAGGRASQTVELEAGPLEGPGGQPFAHTLEPTLRGLGLPTRLNKGTIELIARHTVCTEGRKLTSHQAALLRHLDIRMARASLSVAAALLGKDEAEYVEFERPGGDASGSESEDGAAFEDGLPASMMLPA